MVYELVLNITKGEMPPYNTLCVVVIIYPIELDVEKRSLLKAKGRPVFKHSLGVAISLDAMTSRRPPESESTAI